MEMTNTYAFGFKGQTVTLHFNPRIDVCNSCRAVVGEIDAQRNRVRYLSYHLHHEAYDPEVQLAQSNYVLNAMVSI
jgi:hypothetical protein